VSVYSSGSAPPTSFNSPSMTTYPIPRDASSQSPPLVTRDGGIRLPNAPLSDIASLQQHPHPTPHKAATAPTPFFTPSRDFYRRGSMTEPPPPPQQQQPQSPQPLLPPPPTTTTTTTTASQTQPPQSQRPPQENGWISGTPAPSTENVATVTTTTMTSAVASSEEDPNNNNNGLLSRPTVVVA
jgi:GATA-binding protein